MALYRYSCDFIHWTLPQRTPLIESRIHRIPRIPAFVGSRSLYEPITYNTVLQPQPKASFSLRTCVPYSSDLMQIQLRV